MSVSELVFLKSFRHYSAKMPANTKVFAPLYACTERKIQSKKSENQDFSRRKGADILSYIKSGNTEKDDFQAFERVRILTHLLKEEGL